MGEAERNEVSMHEVKVYRALEQAPAWVTSREIATVASIAPRTARSHALKLVRLGLVDVAEVFPGHMYRLSAKASKRNAGYLDRLKRAAEVFGL